MESAQKTCLLHIGGFLSTPNYNQEIKRPISLQVLTGTPEHGSEGGSASCPGRRGKEGRSAHIILSSNKHFSQFFLTIVLLSSHLENGEPHKVSCRQSNEVEYPSFIGSFFDVL